MDWVIVWDLNEVLFKSFRLDRDTFGIVLELNSMGYDQYVLTNTRLARLDRVRGFFKAKRVFKEILSARELGYSKPDPRAYEYLKENIKDKRICFVDNSPLNVEAARGVGIESIRYINDKKLIEDLKLLGIYK